MPSRDPDTPVFDFQLNPEKTLTASTLKIYRGSLNKITAASYEQSLKDKRKKPILNKKDLLAKNKQVVDIINSLTESRATKCALYSAVFYAVGTKNLTKNKKYSHIVDEFRKIYNDSTYEAYKAKKAEADEADGQDD